MKNIIEILNWYKLSGIDTIAADEPYNALQQTIPAENKPEVSVNSSPVRPATTLLAQESNSACLNAKEKCAQASTLDELKNILEKFEGCSLKFSANSTVFGDGNAHARVMLIGEAPGADEDRMGKPFVGRSGQLLEKMLASIGLNRRDCYISNILPWRPPGNRTPTDGEIAVCLPFLLRQIELVEPKVIFLLGASAANAILGNNESISSMRGKLMELQLNNGKKTAAFASFHPAYLLRSSAQKAKSWNDLLRLKRYLEDE
ncbi:MAG: uracil-DNA glycosylase [Alphaproteobacteria bacterium]|nr:uracil-DNA glycosylase [Alphaproteobacteria bacterium]